MIEQTLQFIREQLAADPNLDLDSDEIIADNFHTLATNLQREGLFYSIINIEEEATLKNRPNFFKEGGQLKRIQPPVVLNLYVLFAFRLSDYNASILKLSELIGFFQTNRWFDFGDLTETQQLDPPIDRLVFELYNTNFEQLNHIWSVLGGNHYPSALYKIRVVKLQRNETEDAPEIKSIKLDSGLSI